MGINQLDYLYLLVLGTAAICSCIWFPRHDKGLKTIAILLDATFLAECLASFCARRYHNNMPVYSIFNLLQLFLICLYFNYSIDVFRTRQWGILIGIGGVLVGIANIKWLQPLNHLNNYFLFFEGIVTICLALFYFARCMIHFGTTDDEPPLFANPHIWVALTLTFFWAVTFCSWGAYEYLNVNSPDKVKIINVSILIVNIITYGSLGLIFIRNRKALQPQ